MLGLAEGGYDYSTRGDAMTPDVIATLDRFMADVVDGRIDVPVRPEGPVLVLDNDGNEIDEAPVADEPPGFDFPQQFSPVAPGTYDLTSLGTPQAPAGVSWRCRRRSTGMVASSGNAAPNDDGPAPKS